MCILVDWIITVIRIAQDAHSTHYPIYRLMSIEGDGCMIKILIADAQPMVRKGLRMRLSTEKDITIVGEASDGVETERIMLETNPDMVILDAEIPMRDGFTTTRSLRKANPLVDIILLSLRGDPALRTQAQIVGASAFIEKQEGAEKLLDTIRRIQALKGTKNA